jgi:hypothetical protein
MNIRNVRILALSAVVGAAPFAAHAVNLVANGSFDNTNNTWIDNTGLGGDDLLSSGGTIMPGWSAVSGLANDLWITTPSGYGLTQSPGNTSAYFVDLTGEGNAKPYGGIQQTIATQAGVTYSLNFDLGSSTLYDGPGPGASAIDVVAMGSSVLKSGAFVLAPVTNNDWATETFTFTANSASTTIQLLADNAYTSRYVGLDNVSVTAAVPEPASVALMIAGLGALGAASRRRAGVR